jgi:hypothetical protein
MTPKEKAEDILDKCYGVEVESVYFGVNHYLAKKFALIVVDEMLDFRNALYINEGSLAHKYLLDIKQEIENIDAEYKKADKEAFNLINKKTKL